MEKKRRTKEQRQADQMNKQLLEELFSIAMGKDSSTGEPVAIKDRLKAMELIADLRKKEEKQERLSQPVVIVDDITKHE